MVSHQSYEATNHISLCLCAAKKGGFYYPIFIIFDNFLLGPATYKEITKATQHVWESVR
jgi:hypothetical protein